MHFTIESNPAPKPDTKKHTLDEYSLKSRQYYPRRRQECRSDRIPAIRSVPVCIRCGIRVNHMKDQNAPMWRNGQTPSSQGQSGSQNDAERQAQQQNQKSEQNKRSH